MTTLKLNSIAEEAAACREAFKGFKVGGFTLHCHHEQVGETLTEEAENRIAYILSSKPEHERAIRLRLFRPVSVVRLKKFKKANADWQKAYADRQKANADRQKANADWQKADADWQKADADWRKANAVLGEQVHKKFCVKGCPWNGHTTFP
jgi:hypothetical protein